MMLNHMANAMVLRTAVVLFLLADVAAGWTGEVEQPKAAEPSRGQAGLQPATGLRAEFEQALASFDQAQQIQREQPDRARELFLSGAKAFERIARKGLLPSAGLAPSAGVLPSAGVQPSAGVVNGRLEFNIGNAYLQAGDIGRAILHYRRAERLIPRDPLLADNLAVAQRRCLTNIAPPSAGPPARRRALIRTVFFWHFETSIRSRAGAAIGLYLAAWTLLTARNFIPRRWVTATAIVCGGLTLVLGGSLAANRWADRNAPAGVVTAMDTFVFKGPGTGYQRQFEQPLQPGVEFTLRERRAGWWNIELPDGQPGWIDSTSAALVPLSSREVAFISLGIETKMQEYGCESDRHTLFACLAGEPFLVA